MGTFRCALILSAALWAGGSTFGQDAAPANPAIPQPLPDTNAPTPPVLPQIDPNLPVPLPADTTIATPAPAAPAPVKKPAPPKIPSVKGTVAKLDSVGMALTLDVKGKEQLYKITSKTRTFADGKPAILSDGKPGENATVEYRALKDKSREALTIRFGSATATPKAAVKKKETAEKKPADTQPANPPSTTDPAAVTPLPTDPGAPK